MIWKGLRDVKTIEHNTNDYTHHLSFIAILSVKSSQETVHEIITASILHHLQAKTSLIFCILQRNRKIIPSPKLQLFAIELRPMFILYHHVPMFDVLHNLLYYSFSYSFLPHFILPQSEVNFNIFELFYRLSLSRMR